MIRPSDFRTVPARPLPGPGEKGGNLRLGRSKRLSNGVLAAFAGLLRTSVRGHDTVIRWGGEEFLVICPSCDTQGASSLAERLIAACAAGQAEDGRSGPLRVPVLASLGLAPAIRAGAVWR